MKVYINPAKGNEALEPIKNKMLLEGEMLVSDQANADMALSLTPLERMGCPVVGVEINFPPKAIELMGFKLANCEHDFILSRWYDGGFRHQTLIGFPAHGLLNEGLGAPVVSGMATKFVYSEKINELFANTSLLDTLKAMRYCGFVSFKMSSYRPDYVVSLGTGIPHYGIFNALEGRDTSITAFMNGDRPDLKSSWVCGVHITRWPYPLETLADKVSVGGLSDSLLKHFWAMGIKNYQRTHHTDKTFIGVVTCWGLELYAAADRATATAKQIELPHKQFRSDFRDLGRVWARVRETRFAEDLEDAKS